MIGRQGLAEVRQHSAEPTPCSTWTEICARFCTLHSFPGGELQGLTVHSRTKEHKKSHSHKRLHHVIYERKQTGLPCSLFLLFLFHCATISSSGPATQVRPRQDLRTDNILLLSSFSAFISLLPHSVWAKHSYHFLFHIPY